MLVGRVINEKGESMEFDEWIQDVMYHMMMAKMNEMSGILHPSGNQLLRVIRNNDISFRAMYECGLEPHDVPDAIRETNSMWLNPR